MGQSSTQQRRPGLNRRGLLGGTAAAVAAASSFGDHGVAGASQATPIVTPGPAGLDRQAANQLWAAWQALWNGDLARAQTIIAPDFVAHFAPAGNSPSQVRGPKGLTDWISGSLGALEHYRFETEVGPLVDGDLLAGRWRLSGAYRGGVQGSSPDAVGKGIAYAGHDLIRVEAGRIVEYWLCADILQFLQQIGVIPA